MTFSGLPSLRDPKQSYKNSASSASSAASSTSSSSSTASSPVKTTPTEEQPHYAASEGGALPTLIPTNDAEHANGLASVTVSPGEAMSASLIEASFQDLVQANYHSTLDSKLGAVPSVLDLKQSAAAPKKKASTPHNLSPAHSAAYRKRLNVNQVCDWCRYRKIRCDRESPCNSCQHSKRECIRTPPSVLLSNQNKDRESDADQPDSTSKTKRGRMDDDKDAPSRRASKSYRGSSISSHLSSSYTSYSSGDDDGLDGDDDRLSVTSSMTHTGQSLPSTPTSLTLAELGLAGLDGLGSGSPLHLLGSLDAAGSGSNSQQIAGSPSFSSPSLNSQGNLQDQEHLERMRRIELLLCNVIPGASEFIAHGTQNSLVSQQQQLQQQSSEQKGHSLNLHGLKSRQKRDVILSPQELLSRISLASPEAGPAASLGVRNMSGLAALHEEDPQSSEVSNHELEQQHNLSPSQQAGTPSLTPDYVQHMERIEILLRTVQKLPLAQGMFSETQKEHPDASEDLSASRKKQPQKHSKKHGKTETRKQKSGNMINSNGAVVKRPHVAAGFAGQKPPPKLPQAIAEAARKRQTTRKKRVTAAAARAAATTNTAATATASVVDASATNSAAAQSSTSLRLDVQDPTQRSSATPLAVPSTPMNVSLFNHDQELQQQACRLQQQQQQQQQQRQIEMLGHPHRQLGVPAFNMYQQHKQSQHRLPGATINSMAIPMASSYGSLVVPASSSTCSSATSSPRTERAEAFNVGGAEQEDMSMSPRSENSSVRAGSVDQMHFSEAQFPFRQQSSGHSMHSVPYSQVQAPPAIGMGMDFNLMGQTEIQPFSGQYVSQLHQRLPTSQENSYSDFGLNMGESLESLMKKNMGSFGGLLSDLSGGAPLGSADSTITSPSLSMPMQSLLQGPSAPTFEHGVYDPSATAVQFNYLQQQRELQQRQVRLVQPVHQETLKSMWIPNHSGSFAVPANTEFSWQQQQQQHHSTPSINISANDSPQSEVAPEPDLDGDQLGGTQEQQQQPLSAHALFQQQHEQQQQQEQLRRNSLALDALQPQQHRGSIQHQHLQSFYIPQMQDDDDDGVFQAMYDSTKSTAGEDMWSEEAPLMAASSSSIHSGNPEA